MMLRFHTQTGGSTLTAQQPENNIVRTTIQAFAATLGGTQSLHTNGFDEALGLPTERAAKLALRTQQVLGFESGIADTVDPLAGSYFVESLTNEVERLAREYIATIDERGGAVAAIESHYMQDEIESAAYEFARGVDRGEKVVVGVNRFEESESTKADVFPIDEEQQRTQIARVTSLKHNRDNDGVRAALEELAVAARGSANVLYPMKTALSRRATLGEVADVLRVRIRGLPAELVLDRLVKVGHDRSLGIERMRQVAPPFEGLALAKRHVRLDRLPLDEQEVDRAVLLLAPDLATEAVGHRVENR